MDKDTFKTVGGGSFGAVVIVLLFNIQSGIADLNKAVAENDSRLDLVEYRINQGG